MAMRYSLWLVPATGGAFDRSCSATIADLAARTGAAPFATHLTLCPSFTGSQQQALAVARRVAAAVTGPVDVALSRPAGGALISTSASWNRALVLEAEPTSRLLAAAAAASAAAGHDRESESAAAYRPHVSLLYGVFAAERLAELAEPLAKSSELAPGAAPTSAVQHAHFVAPAIAVVMTTGPYPCWVEVGRVEL
jgi:hypothetical protein